MRSRAIQVGLLPGNEAEVPLSVQSDDLIEGRLINFWSSCSAYKIYAISELGDEVLQKRPSQSYIFKKARKGPLPRNLASFYFVHLQESRLDMVLQGYY